MGTVVNTNKDGGGINPFPFGNVCGRFFENGRKITLTAQFAYFSKAKQLFVVPEGFTSDFNSVPRGAWNFFPPWEYPEAAVTHDWLYRHPGELKRSDIDAIHREIMEVEGASRVLRWLAWGAIRVGGRKSWNNYRKQGLR